MEGMAESRIGGASFYVKQCLSVGQVCTMEDIARALGCKPAAVRGGVYHTANADCFAILVTLEKGSETTPYQDSFFESSSLLFWEGQNSKRIAEKAFNDGLDCHVFIHRTRRSVYTYYGRAVVLRQQINPIGTPSRFVLYLPEYESLSKKQEVHDGVVAEMETSYFAGSTERQNLQTIRTKQSAYRQDVIALWHGQCAVTGVDETEWLIASHIKPWRESTDSERVDPKNSLLLSPNYDKLFDRGVISFKSSNGKILLPEKMSAAFWRNLDRLGINDEKYLSFIPSGTEKYLDYHRNTIFGYEPVSGFSADVFLENLLRQNIVIS